VRLGGLSEGREVKGEEKESEEEREREREREKESQRGKSGDHHRLPLEAATFENTRAPFS